VNNIHGNRSNGGFNFALLLALSAIIFFVVVLLIGCAPAQKWDKASEVYEGFQGDRLGVRYVTVSGEVWKPCHLPWVKGISTYDAIVYCGGMRPEGDASSVRLLRGDQKLRLNIKRFLEGHPEEDMLTLPGDLIYVDPRWNVATGRFLSGLLGLGTSAASLAVR
jgi:hypothetical protein